MNKVKHVVALVAVLGLSTTGLIGCGSKDEADDVKTAIAPPNTKERPKNTFGGVGGAPAKGGKAGSSSTTTE